MAGITDKEADAAFLQGLIDGTADHIDPMIIERMEQMFERYADATAMLALVHAAADAYSDEALAAAAYAMEGFEIEADPTDPSGFNVRVPPPVARAPVGGESSAREQRSDRAHVERELRERGVVTGNPVQSFQRAGPAHVLARTAGRAVVHVPQLQVAACWVVDQADADRMVAEGYRRLADGEEARSEADIARDRHRAFLQRELREQGLIQGQVLTFAGRAHAERFARRVDSAVMFMAEALNEGHFWVVNRADADRLQAAGHERVYG
jgi:hypothetical protein